MILSGLLPLSALKASENYLCKGDIPFLVRLEFSMQSPSRLAATIDSEELYPHTGKSWRLLWTRVLSPSALKASKVVFMSYDEFYLYHLQLPLPIADGAVLEEFNGLLTWQTDEKGSVYSALLKCYDQSKGPG